MCGHDVVNCVYRDVLLECVCMHSWSVFSMDLFSVLSVHIILHGHAWVDGHHDTHLIMILEVSPDFLAHCLVTQTRVLT